MFNVHILEQRVQSDACIGYAEPRQNRSEAQCSQMPSEARTASIFLAAVASAST